jgi:sulfoxide reductase heme-binding subunit YedZ
MGGRLVKGRGADLRVIHEALAIGTIAAIALHALSLLGDAYFHPSLADITIPFVRDYKQPFMAIGIIAGWSFVVFGLSYHLRARIGVARWRIIHRFTALAWALGVIHTLGEGSDAGRTWFLVVVTVAAAPTLVLLLWRLTRRRGAGVPASTFAPATPNPRT